MFQGQHLLRRQLLFQGQPLFRKQLLFKRFVSETPSVSKITSISETTLVSTTASVSDLTFISGTLSVSRSSSVHVLGYWDNVCSGGGGPNLYFCFRRNPVNLPYSRKAVASLLRTYMIKRFVISRKETSEPRVHVHIKYSTGP
jgi:hypothetical protein